MLTRFTRLFLRTGLFPVAFGVMLLAASCKKEDPVKVVHGNITLKVNVLHHSWPVHFLPVYLKRNVTEWPGRDSTLYDQVTETGQDGSCTFSNLYVGDYYVYGSGYDPVVQNHVIGYAPVTLNSATVVNNTMEITLYVSE
jgi:hypothetical protein